MTTRFQHRILIGAISIAALLAGCSGKHETPVQVDEGEPVAKSSVVPALKMADAETASQLGKGFYGLEANAWRWTAGNFSATLKVPAGAAQKGATLTLKLNVSDAVLKKVSTQTLSASIGTTKLAPATYSKGGAYDYTADVPAVALSGDTVTVDFSLDHSLAPSPSDKRELGVIVTSIGLESK